MSNQPSRRALATAAQHTPCPSPGPSPIARRALIATALAMAGTALAAGTSVAAAPAADADPTADPGSALITGRAPLPPSATVATGLVARLAVDQAADSPQHSDGAILTYVVTPNGSVQVRSSDLESVPTGAKVHVRLGPTSRASGTAASALARAGRQATEVRQLSGPAKPQVRTSSPASTTVAAAAYAHTVTMVLVIPAGGAADSMTTTTFRTWLEGTAGPFWNAESEGALTFAVASTRSWVTSPYSCTAANGLNLFADVARQVEFSSGPGKHLAMYIAPTAGTASCPSGLGTVGSSLASGGTLFVKGTQKSLLSHELGHNLSLGHSSALRCPSTADGTYAGGLWSNSCKVATYYDMYDVMGFSWASTGALNTFHANRLGLLGTGRVVTASSSTRVSLRPVSGHTGLVSLRINDPTGQVYVVEYRTASGRDAFLASNPYGVRAGVTVRRGDPSTSGQSLLLDATPSVSGDYVVPIAVGSTMTTASGRVKITTESATSTSATVAVRFDNVAPPAALKAARESTPDSVTLQRSRSEAVATR